MPNLIARLRALVWDEHGQDLIEYALLASLLVVVAIVAVGNAGGEVERLWTNIADGLPELE